MHFSKTYTQLLLSLPEELRDNAIQYRQLKKLINQVVLELSSLGLSPTVLQELLEPGTGSGKETDEVTEVSPLVSGEDGPAQHPSGDQQDRATLPKVVYEFNDTSGKIEPRLRVWVNPMDRRVAGLGGVRGAPGNDSEESLERVGEEDPASPPEVTPHSNSLLWSLQRQSGVAVAGHDAQSMGATGGTPHEVVIPLVSDTAFFQMLATALQALSAHLLTVHLDFVDTLHDLSRTIGDSARPASSTSGGFHPSSGVTAGSGHMRLGFPAFAGSKSDLYSWREIFQLYVEAEVFESVSEASRGEWSVEESEQRLKLFAERVTRRGLGDGRHLKMKHSRAALETFLELNLFILNIKKFQFANAEATRKILKKHTKRTALRLSVPGSNTGAFSQSDYYLSQLALLPQSNVTSLPRVLVQAIGETLLPIIPHLDDYACLICTSIAFKPIRLNCGHLFCVRCLVKMQKRGNGDCPMCRAPSVLTADRSNVDWALLNFMQDWFPLESKEKLKSNEKEAAEEELIELGLDPRQGCVIM